MDRDIKKLFDDGINNGNIIISAKDGKEIICHSFVIKNQTSFQSFWSKESSGMRGSEKIKLEDYDSIVLIAVLNKMYNSEFMFNNLSPYAIISAIKLIDYIAMKHSDSVVIELCELFNEQITTKNWKNLLEMIYGNKIYEKLINRISYFILNGILEHDIIDNDPFDGIDMNSDLGKFLTKLLRRKIQIQRPSTDYDIDL